MTKISTPSINIKHKGIFDLSAVLQGIKNWFEGDEFKVHYPAHKLKQPAGGWEHEMTIYGERKMNEYVKFTITLFIRLYDIKDIEVIKEGKKVQTNSGRITADISGEIELDFENRFDGSKFLQAFQDFYHKYIIKQDIGDYWEDEIMLKIVNLGKFIREMCQQEAVA
ncbi:hypothetical protein GF343_00660 [Candidatus Woesearchaeota archaeon]|nr:hypothetical protein [Candidatus Woesearchaeota archaeon]